MAFERDKDPSFLRKAAGLLESENRRLLQQVIDLRERVKVLEGEEATQLAIQNEELQRQLALRNKKIFGNSSEKRAHSGLGDKDQSAPQTGHGPREQTELDIVVRVHELDTADRACPQCGGALQAWDVHIALTRALMNARIVAPTGVLAADPMLAAAALLT